MDPFLPWIVAGYFNVITNLEEKRGGIALLGPSSSMLRDNIGFLNLIDVKPRSRIFTWNNRRSGTEAISERLDRFLVSYFGWILDGLLDQKFLIGKAKITGLLCVLSFYSRLLGIPPSSFN